MKETLISFTSFMLTIILILAFGEYFVVSPVDITAKDLFSLGHSTTWVNLHSNATFSWRINPFFLFIAKLIGGDPNLALAAIALSIFSAGMTFLIINIKGSLEFSSLFLGPWVSILYFLFWGTDLVVSQCVAWVPLFISCLYDLLKKHTSDANDIVGLLIVASLIIFSSQQIAPIVVITSIAFAFTLRAKEDNDRKEIYKDEINITPIAKKLVIACLLLSTIPLFFAESPELPNYLHNSKVIQSQNLLGNTMPLVGTFPSIPIIDYVTLQKTYWYLGAMFLMIICANFIFERNINKFTHLNKYSYILTLALLFDTMLPQNIALIGPIQTITRLVPGLFFFTLTPIIAAIVTFSLALCTSLTNFKANLSLFSFFILHAIFGILLYSQTDHISSLLIPNEKYLAYKDYQQLPLEEKFNEEDLSTFRKIIFSPSYPVINHFGLSTSINAKQIDSFNWTNPSQDSLSFRVSGGEGSENILDINPTTRWSSGTGQQTGNEWIEIVFNQPQLIKGLSLDTGDFTSDFPRALNIEIEKSLPLDDSSLHFNETIFNQAWLGPLRFTEDGYPFFGSQSEVEIVFPEVKEIQRIKIAQTGKSKNFDWSIATLKFLVASDSSLIKREPREVEGIKNDALEQNKSEKRKSKKQSKKK
jgi:hypothetical protein